MAAAATIPAYAQDQDSQPAETQTVVVTGSRIVRQDYVANSPITSVSQSQIVNNADLTLETALNNLPQIVAGATTTSNNPGNGGRANIDLRGLGANRNLVLVNGRRPMVSDNNLTVDVNTIPAALIDSVEVITGGGGAVYGADAVAGVVNIKLKDNFEGFDLSSSYSQSTEYHDSEDYTVSALIGGNFSDGKGNAVLAFDRTSREPLIKSQRPFSVLATSTTGTPPQGVLRWGAGNQVPLTAIQQVFAQYGVAPTDVTNSSGRIGFNRDGTLFFSGVFNSPLDVQNFRDPIDAGVNTKFYPDFYSYNFDAVNLLTLPLHRTALMSNLHYEVSDKAEFFGSLAWTEYTAATALAPTPAPSVATAAPGTCTSTEVCSALVAPGQRVTGSLIVPVTNKWISDDLRALLNARSGDDPLIADTGAAEAFRFGIRPVAFGLRQENFKNDVQQYLGGIRGQIEPNHNWGYELSFSEGRTQIDDTQNGNIQTQLLTDVLADPDGAVNGACADWNPFGTNPIPTDCINALKVTTATTLRMKQQITQGFVHGDLFEMPAGAVSVVLGAERRRFTYDFNPGSGAGPISGFNTRSPEGGNTTFNDVFTEALLPLVRDARAAKSLDLTLGYRYSQSQFKDVINNLESEKSKDSSYKAELSWQPLDVLRLRASYQRAVRAPNFSELFQAGGSFPQIFDPCSRNTAARTGANAAAVADLCAQTGATNLDQFVATPGAQAFIDTAGNTDLKPEKADTYTLGTVFSVPSESRWLERFRGSIDYYSIKVNDAILVPDPNVGIAACFNYLGTNPNYSPDYLYCQGMLRAGDIAGIVDVNTGDEFRNTNDGRIKTSGIDFQFDYGFDLNWMGLPENSGAIRMNLLLSRLLEYKLVDTPGVPEIDYAGTINYFGGGISLGQTFPDWRAVLTTDYNIGQFGVSLRGRYIDKMKNRGSVQYVGESSFSGVGSVTYWDVAGVWRFKENSELRIGLNNAFDKQPPQYAPNIQSGTDPGTYDVIGRRAFARFEVKF
ncbi:MAG TPA: TonB-dependent receptor [Steroidobacteraceae bacterium]|nr:TonB-dependent receptor [Steroidobacteraceae bacterium]